MTDLDVLAALDTLEALLAGPASQPNGDAVATWHEAFKRALAGAERGFRWGEVQARGRVLGNLLSQRMALVRAARDVLGRDLAKVASGRRALKGYRP